MPSINLYQIPQVINTTQAGSVGVESSTNKINFDVSKNVTTEVEFLLKNIDRKLIIDPTITLVIFIMDQNRNLKLQRPLTVINQGRGHYRLTLNPCDINDWDTGYYPYTVVAKRPDQNQILLHSDHNRSTSGYLELKQGPLPTPKPSVTLSKIDFLSRINNNTEYFESGSYIASAQNDNKSGKHTCAIYSTNFKGSFSIEASLENGYPESTAWFKVDSTSIDTTVTSGITTMLFTGSYMWVRFIYTPDKTNVGSINQVLFKS